MSKVAPKSTPNPPSPFDNIRCSHVPSTYESHTTLGIFAPSLCLRVGARFCRPKLWNCRSECDTCLSLRLSVPHLLRWVPGACYIKSIVQHKLCSHVVGVLDGAYRTKTHFAKPFRAFQVKPTLSSCSRYTMCRLAETRNWCTERDLECSVIFKPSPALSTAALASVTQHSLVCGVWKLSGPM